MLSKTEKRRPKLKSISGVNQEQTATSKEATPNFAKYLRQKQNL